MTRQASFFFFLRKYETVELIPHAKAAKEYDEESASDSDVSTTK